MKLLSSLLIIGVTLFTKNGYGQQPLLNSPYSHLSPQQEKQKTDSLFNIQMQQAKLKRDSAQRKIMKDSLDLSDLVISQILASNESYLIEVELVRKDSTLTPSAMNSMLASLRRQNAEVTKELMGVKYEKYLAIITGQ